MAMIKFPRRIEVDYSRMREELKIKVTPFGISLVLYCHFFHEGWLCHFAQLILLKYDIKDELLCEYKIEG